MKRQWPKATPSRRASPGILGRVDQSAQRWIHRVILKEQAAMVPMVDPLRLIYPTTTAPSLFGRPR